MGTLEEEIAIQRRQLEALSARLNSFSSAKKDIEQTQYEFREAWWRVDYHSTGSAYTSGQDWDTHFEDTSNTVTKGHRIATLDGSIESEGFGDDMARRLRIAFDSDQKFDFPFWIRGSFGRIQFRFNSKPSTPVEYTSSQTLTLTASRGANWIQLTTNCNQDELIIVTNFLDHKGVTWRDPNEEESEFGQLAKVDKPDSGTL